MSSKPLFFFVHGAWATSWSFTPLISQLWSLGYPTWSRELAFAGDQPTTTAQDDIDFIRSELRKLSDAGHEIVIICFSYGGNLGAACVPGLTVKERRAKGERGGLIGLVLASAPLTPKGGMSATEVIGSYKNPEWFGGLGLSVVEKGPLVTFKDEHKELFYNGIPNPESHRQLFDHLFAPVVWASHETILPATAFVNTECSGPEDCGGFILPTAYFMTTQDKCVPISLQETVHENYKAHWSKVVKFDCGHLWGIAAPEAGAKALIDFAAVAREETGL